MVILGVKRMHPCSGQCLPIEVAHAQTIPLQQTWGHVKLVRASVTVGLVVWSWLVKTSSLAVYVVKGLWPVPMVVVIIWLRTWPAMVAWCSQREDFVWTVLGEVGEPYAVITLCIRAVVANVASLSTDKTSIIVWHHIDCRGCQDGHNLLCYIELWH